MRAPHEIAPPAKLGFSLVELSIVLVILGLLVGGVLSGKSLIRASELRSITTQYDEFRAATNIFKEKYFALPGDITNATQFWGQIAVGAACRTTSSTDKRTCDGNGNGTLKRNLSDPNSFYEGYWSWQHLANAGLIAGQYPGVGSSSGPKGKIPRSYWIAGNYDNITGNNYVVGFHGDGLLMRGDLSPQEVWRIDSKLDDENPIKGKIIAFDSVGYIDTATSSDCLDPTVVPAVYKLAGTTNVCSPLFLNNKANPEGY